MDNRKLIDKALEAMNYAYAPYSKFKVGAALITDGVVYTGCNIENSSFGATICAERCAISKAVSEGHKNIQKIAIVSSSGDFTPPCGICRQVMEEFMADGTVVLSNGKEIKEYTVRELLPAGFFCGGYERVMKWDENQKTVLRIQGSRSGFCRNN